MNSEAKCPECGLALPPDAVEGLCPRCLLKRAQDSNTAASKAEAKTIKEETPPPAPDLAELALLFPQLEILELLGRGGMGVVYKARQTKLDRWVALKILPASAARQPGFPERFSREARALAKLQHPGIVGIHDLGQAGDICYLIMEYVEGASLRTVIENKLLQPAEALKIVVQICEALQYAHDEGVVHRDIKPGNILIDKRGRVKIADFGLAKLLDPEGRDHTLTASHQVMGTPHYMAPEQIDKPLEVDHRADIYSLGVVFYEMLTGELPLGRFAPPSRKVQVDIRLDEVILRSLEASPEQRYQKVSDVQTDVENISHRNVPSPTPATRSEKPGWAHLKKPALVAFATVLAVALAQTLFLQGQLWLARNAVRAKAAEWERVAPGARAAERELKELADLKKNLGRLEAYTTNRFLWHSILGKIPIVTNVQVHLIHTRQLFSILETNRSSLAPMPGEGTPKSPSKFLAEEALLTLWVRDFSGPAGAQLESFMDGCKGLGGEPRLLDRSVQPMSDPKDPERPGELFIPATIEIAFPRRTRFYE